MAEVIATGAHFAVNYSYFVGQTGYRLRPASPIEKMVVASRIVLGIGIMNTIVILFFTMLVVPIL